MAEIGMGKGAGAASFAAGFGKGLSNALLMNRQRSDQKHREDREAQYRQLQMILPTVLQGYDPDHPEFLEGFFRQHLPEFFDHETAKGKGSKALQQGGGPFDKLKDVLGGIVGIHRQRIPIESGWPGGPVSIEMGGNTGYFGSNPPVHTPSRQPEGVTGGTIDNRPVYGLPQPVNAAPGGQALPQPFDTAPDISQTALGGAQAPPAQAEAARRRTLFGVPMLSEEELATRAGRRAGLAEGAKTEAELQARNDLARRLIANGMPAAEAYDRAGLKQTTAGSGGAISPSKLFADQLARRQEELKRPLTADEVAKERQAWEALNDRAANLGIYAEAAARELGFPNADAAAQAGQMDAVNKRADEISASRVGAATGARVAEQGKAPLTTKQKFDALMGLQDDWRKADNPAREMQRQLQLMETGLKRFREGDKVGGSQAVLVTFQKILDPTSVVRESEYARSSAGLGLMDRIEGMYERLKAGGAGVPEPELAAMAETARQFLAGMSEWNAIEKERINSTANEYGINPDRIFGTGGGRGTTAPPAGSSTTPAAPTGHKYTYDPATGQWK